MKIDIINLEFIESLLRSMVSDVEHHFGFEFTITSLYRIDDTGVHGALPLRGVDLRCRDEEVGIVIEKYVNKKYQYDPDRLHMMCCLLHDTGGGLHLHLQCHPNTIVVNQ